MASGQTSEKIANKIIATELFKDVVHPDSHTTLLIIEPSHYQAIVATTKQLAKMKPNAKGRSYVKKQLSRLLQKQSDQDQHNAQLRAAIDKFSYFDSIVFSSDTAWLRISRDESCYACFTTQEQSFDGNLSLENTVVMHDHYSSHAGIEGCFFYNLSGKLLLSPFPEYISSRSRWNAILSAFNPNIYTYQDPERIIEKINKEIYKNALELKSLYELIDKGEN